jgi:hypothetical protein
MVLQRPRISTQLSDSATLGKIEPISPEYISMLRLRYKKLSRVSYSTSRNTGYDAPRYC